mgnify:CR=1 FL=1
MAKNGCPKTLGKLDLCHCQTYNAKLIVSFKLWNFWLLSKGISSKDHPTIGMALDAWTSIIFTQPLLKMLAEHRSTVAN